MRFGIKTIERVFRVLLRALIKLVSYVDHRRYMSLYNAYLAGVGVQMKGKAVYISSSVRLDGADYSLIEINEGVVISSGVRILTHDFSVDRVLQDVDGFRHGETFIARPVTIGKNVFIGAGSIILPGTTIGDGSIVGAGSVVRGSIPSSVVVTGNPASVVSDVASWAEEFTESGSSRRASLKRLPGN